jgi:anti-sigma factor RsiW
MSCPGFEALLDAYFDNELPIPESQAADRHLAACAACRTRYEALEWLRAEIRDAGSEYTPSPSFVLRVRKLTADGGKTRGAWWWGTGLLAAALFLLLVAPHISLQPERGGRQILDSHLRSLLAGNLVDVPSSDRHTVKPWFQGRLQFSPSVPDLSRDGFALVGGRIEVFNQQRAAALVYKRREHVISLFIVEDGSGPSGQSPQTQGYNLISWADRGLSYWAVSDLNIDELSSFAELVRSR